MKTRIALISTNLKDGPSHLFAPIFLPFPRIRANSCNSCLLFALFAFLAVTSLASTNDLTSTLQKGLFEEEANRNFPAAIESYQSVINRFGEDRKLAATAIFRLGEIYRKQGNTNEASAQYERVVREFPDQSALATLSQSYLAAETPLSANASRTNTTSESALTSDEAEDVKKIRALIRDSPDLINAKDQGGNTRLHTAAYNGHLVVARFLVENGADPNIPNSEGETALHYAALFGHKSLVELFLDHGAAIEASDRSGNAPLHDAARMGFRSIVELLLARGADVNAKTKSGSTPLHLAVASGFKSVAELLLSHGADVNPQTSGAPDQANQHTYKGAPLHIAATRDDEPIAELLLAHHANPNATNSAGDTPLHVASEHGDQKLAELLLDNKAAVDPVNNNGETPLDSAAKSGHTEVVSLLLSHGADVNARNPLDRGSHGWTPLIYAVSSQQKETTALLLKNKADPNIKVENSSTSFTPLLIATMQADSDIVATLLNFKTDPNAKGDWTPPIFKALDLNDRSIAKNIASMLLDHGADTESRNGEGKTPLIVAVERKDKEIVDLLLAHKADVNAKNRDGLTALHFAIFSLNSSSPGIVLSPPPMSFNGRLGRVQRENNSDVVPEILAALLDAGANPNLQSNEGKTALNYVAQNFPPNGILDTVRSKIRELLVAHGAVLDLPRLDTVEVRRPQANFSKVIFTKGTNGWDRFTLFDLIGVQYKFLSAAPSGETRESKSPFGSYAPATGLDFPDFKRIVIRHPKPDMKNWEERIVDLTPAFTAGECSVDVPLQLGDQVEIPQSDHILNATWEGFSTNDLKGLEKCLSRQISIAVKGQSRSITLGPDIHLGRFAYGAYGRFGEMIELKTLAPIMIKPALIDSQLLLASSDLSHIKLIRADPATGQKRELIVDCSEGKPAPSVWLRDGDVIEVPDRP